MRMLRRSWGSVTPDNIPGMARPVTVLRSWESAQTGGHPDPGASRPESIIDSAQAPELVLSPEELARLDESRS